MEIKKTSHARYELWYHLAFSTKYRKKVFNDEKTKEEVTLLFREIALHYDLEVGEVQILFRPCASNLDSTAKDCSCPGCNDTEERKHEVVVQALQVAQESILGW